MICSKFLNFEQQYKMSFNFVCDYLRREMPGLLPEWEKKKQIFNQIVTQSPKAVEKTKPVSLRKKNRLPFELFYSESVEKFTGQSQSAIVVQLSDKWKHMSSKERKHWEE